MLDSAIADYVRSLGEREFDVPLRALLRADGFKDIEFVHGVSEYGRDFIAKCVDADGGPSRQYSVQSKVGDIALPDFRKIREQLEDIRTIRIAHPQFNPELEGTIVLVTTGDLKGQASGAVNGYRDTLPEPWRFEFWGGEILIAKLKQHLCAALGERARGSLLSLLGAIDEGAVDLAMLERHTRRWIPSEGEQVAPVDVLEAGLIANRLRDADRLDLACACAIALLRAQLVSASGKEPLSSDAASDIQAAGEFFAGYAESLWARCGDEFLQPPPMVNAHPEFGFWATYPVRCLRLAENLGLLALYRQRRGGEVADLRDWIARLLEGQPGCAHPISDRHALSLVPPAVLLSDNSELVGAWLRSVVSWTADRYDVSRPGLASTDANTEQEIDYLLAELGHLDLRTRHESFIAATVLDLAAALENSDLYDAARHEFLAVHIAPDLRHPPDSPEAWKRDGAGLRQELSTPYDDTYSDQPGWGCAPHHDQAPDSEWATRTGLEWEALAVWCLLRDRYSVAVMRALSTPVG